MLPTTPFWLQKVWGSNPYRRTDRHHPMTCVNRFSRASSLFPRGPLPAQKPFADSLSDPDGGRRVAGPRPPAIGPRPPASPLTGDRCDRGGVRRCHMDTNTHTSTLTAPVAQQDGDHRSTVTHGCVPEHSTSSRALKDQSRGFLRNVPLREVAAPLEPVQICVGEQLRCTGGLTRHGHQVTTTPTDRDPTGHGA